MNSTPAHDSIPKRRIRTRTPRRRRKARVGWLFTGFALLATVHLPIYETSEKAVGWFDLAVCMLSPVALCWLLRKKISWRLPFYLAAYLGMALFTLYAGVTLALNWNRPMLSLIGAENFDFPSLLYIKQIEYLLIVLCTLYLARRINPVTLLVSLGLSLSCVALYGFHAMFISKIWYRLGLIYMAGDASPNPGGFVLSICLLCLIGTASQTRLRHSKRLILFVLFSGIVGYEALIFSYSRTNNISFLVCFGVFIFPLIRRHLLLITCLLIPFVLAANGLFSLFSTAHHLNHYGISPLVFLTHPSLIWNDPSLRLRLNDVWGNAYGAWHATCLTMIFGIGFGKLRLADGLYPNLLFTTGILGLLLYLIPFAVLARQGPRIVRCLMLFILLNGISTETTINSFRSAQVLYVYLPAFLVLLHRSKLALNGGQIERIAEPPKTG